MFSGQTPDSNVLACLGSLEGTPTLRFLGSRLGPQKSWKLHIVGWFCGRATVVWLTSSLGSTPRSP